MSDSYGYFLDNQHIQPHTIGDANHSGHTYSGTETAFTPTQDEEHGLATESMMEGVWPMAVFPNPTQPHRPLKRRLHAHWCSRSTPGSAPFQPCGTPITVCGLRGSWFQWSARGCRSPLK